MKSRVEALILNILGEQEELSPPLSRIEEILYSILNDTAYIKDPLSRIEAIVLAIKEKDEYTRNALSRIEEILKAVLDGTNDYDKLPQSDIERDLIRFLGEWVTKTGDIVTFSTDQVVPPFKRCEVELKPIQDLHGYDNPWPAGGGPNQWDEDWAIGEINNATGEAGTGTLFIVNSFIPVVAGQTYYWKSPYGGTRYFYDSNKAFLQTAYGTANATFTVPEGAAYMKFKEPSQYGSTYNHDIAVNYPATVTTYSPYSNFCPISGWTGCEVQRTGKNLWDEQYTSISSTIRYKPVYVGDGQVTLSTTNPQAFAAVYNLFLLAGNVNSGASSIGNGVGEGNPRTVTAVDGYVTVAYRIYEGSTSPALSQTQLELGSKATTYEPYSGTTYAVEFPILGKNLCPDKKYQKANTIIYIGQDNVTDYPLKFKAGTTYTLSYVKAGGGGCVVYLGKENGGDAPVIGSSNPITFTVSDTGNYRIALSNSVLSVSDITNIQIEEGSTATTYEPYMGIVYKGSHNLVSGDIVSIFASVDLGDLTWAYDSQYSRFRTESLLNLLKVDLTQLARRTTLLCEAYQCIDDGRAISAVPDYCIYVGGGSSAPVFIMDARFTSLSDFKSAVTGIKLVYPLKTPVETELTPHEIHALLGQNNIWADTGNIKVIYHS